MTPTHDEHKPAIFITRAAQWNRNNGAAKVRPAAIHGPEGEPIPGLHIHQRSSNSWLVLSEAHAVDAANQILDVIETRRTATKPRSN